MSESDPMFMTCEELQSALLAANESLATERKLRAEAERLSEERREAFEEELSTSSRATAMVSDLRAKLTAAEASRDEALKANANFLKWLTDQSACPDFVIAQAVASLPNSTSTEQK